MEQSRPPLTCPTTDPWAWSPPTPGRIEQPVTLLRVDGSDSLKFLHGQTSQSIESATPGQWLRTCCITPTARMHALAEVLVDMEGAWLVISAGDGSLVRGSLDRVLFPADRVQLGPLHHALWIQPLDDGGSHPADRWTKWEGGNGFWLGESLLVRKPGSCCAEMDERRLLTTHELERWRIQRGRPASPTEINTDTNPFELGLTRRVHLAKGCYVGQETLAKLATYDGVRRQLRRWHCSLADIKFGEHFVSGQTLRDAEGRRAGQITSSLRLSKEGWIGLALVRRGWLQEERLLAGEDALAVNLSIPDEFETPPVGAGGSGQG